MHNLHLHHFATRFTFTSIHRHFLIEIMYKPIVIFVTSLKGGSGKSTVAWNLALMYAQRSTKVAVLDMDKNQMCFTAYTARHHKQQSSRRDLPNVKVCKVCEPSDRALWDLLNRLKKSVDVIIIDGACVSDESIQPCIRLADFVLLSVLSRQPDIDVTRNSEFLKSIQSIGRPIGIVLNDVSDMRDNATTYIRQLKEGLGIFIFEQVLHRRAANEQCLKGGLCINELQNSYKDEKAQGEWKRLFNELNQLIKIDTNSA